MILSGANVTLTTAVAEDWDYIFDLAKRQGPQKCLPELLPQMARCHVFYAFVVRDRDGKKLGTVHSNYLEEVDGYTIDLYVDEGNAGYIPECFDLFAEFMSRFTDRLYGYIAKGDEQIMRLSEMFGFEPQGEADGYVITMREI